MAAVTNRRHWPINQTRKTEPALLVAFLLVLLCDQSKHKPRPMDAIAPPAVGFCGPAVMAVTNPSQVEIDASHCAACSGVLRGFHSGALPPRKRENVILFLAYGSSTATRSAPSKQTPSVPFVGLTRALCASASESQNLGRLLLPGCCRRSLCCAQSQAVKRHSARAPASRRI